jgi:hypothetical protein
MLHTHCLEAKVFAPILPACSQSRSSEKPLFASEEGSPQGEDEQSAADHLATSVFSTFICRLSELKIHEFRKNKKMGRVGASFMSVAETVEREGPR